MKLRRLFCLGAVAAFLGLPAAAQAQQYPPQQATPYQGQPYQGQPPGGRQHTNPTPEQLQRRFSRMLSAVNLSPAQQQQIAGMIAGYAQAHPAGTPVDPEAARALRRQIMGVLTPDQRAQWLQARQAMRTQRQGGQPGYPAQQEPPQGNPPPPGPPAI